MPVTSVPVVAGLGVAGRGGGGVGAVAVVVTRGLELWPGEPNRAVAEGVEGGHVARGADQLVVAE